MIRFRCTNGKCWSFYANKKHIKWLKSTNAFLSHIYVTFWFISCSPAAPRLKTVHFHSKSVNPVKMNLFHWVLFYVCLNLQKSFKSVTFSSRYFFFTVQWCSKSTGKTSVYFSRCLWLRPLALQRSPRKLQTNYSISTFCFFWPNLKANLNMKIHCEKSQWVTMTWKMTEIWLERRI